MDMDLQTGCCKNAAKTSAIIRVVTSQVLQLLGDLFFDRHYEPYTTMANVSVREGRATPPVTITTNSQEDRPNRSVRKAGTICIVPIVPQESVPLKDEWLDFDGAKDELTKCIESVRQETIVKVHEDFFETARYQIVRKDRDEHQQKKKWLISEQDTCYENFTPKEATYTFQNSFKQTSSVTLTISKGHTFSIGAAAGGGYGGMNVGLTGGAEYSKSRSTGEGESHTETKHLTVAIQVPPDTVAKVKELVYQTECSTTCQLYLLLGIPRATFLEKFKNPFKGKTKPKVKDALLKKKDEIEDVIKFATRDGKDSEIKVSALLADLDRYLERQPWVTKLGDTICIKLSTQCIFTKTEHALETFFQKSDPERRKRIILGKVDGRDWPDSLPMVQITRLPLSPLPKKYGRARHNSI